MWVHLKANNRQYVYPITGLVGPYFISNAVTTDDGTIRPCNIISHYDDMAEKGIYLDYREYLIHPRVEFDIHTVTDYENAERIRCSPKSKGLEYMGHSIKRILEKIEPTIFIVDENLPMDRDGVGGAIPKVNYLYLYEVLENGIERDDYRYKCSMIDIQKSDYVFTKITSRYDCDTRGNTVLLEGEDIFTKGTTE